MLNMSVLSAVAGIVFVAYSGSSGPADGTGWELDAIAAVFVGGAAIAGGVGTITGSIIGGLVLSFLPNGLTLVGIETNQVVIIRGLVLLVAVAFDVYSKAQGRPSVIGYLTRNFRKKSGDDGTPTGPDSVSKQPESIEDQPQVLLP
jgi:putative multiple sugar transport system permease protein